jgi:hypothetical protein
MDIRPITRTYTIPKTRSTFLNLFNNSIKCAQNSTPKIASIVIKKPSLILTLPSFLCLVVMINAVAAVWVMLVPTAIFNGKPRVNNVGVMMKPPPNPKQDEMTATPKPRIA